MKTNNAFRGEIRNAFLRNKKIISDLLITGKPGIKVKEYYNENNEQV